MSVQRTWAFLLVGMITYIPANIMPILITDSYLGNVEDTILSGVFSLIATGSYFVAGVVFFASICIPIAKFLIIALLALSLQFTWDMSEHTRHRLHAVTEFIGRWSMIDVFVVAVLAALIQLGTIMTITPGLAIGAFAVSVVFTMLAASSLDPRLLWDTQDSHTPLKNSPSATL
ncbi:MAG: paraquat-inducible protein A [Granulosicoccus sp.]